MLPPCVEAQRDLAVFEYHAVLITQDRQQHPAFEIGRFPRPS